MSACQFSPQDLMVLEQRLYPVLVEIAQQGVALFETTLPAGVKRDRTLVTEADRLLERMALDKLADITPAWGFVGEEYGSVHRLDAKRHHAPTATAQGASDNGLNRYEKTLGDTEHDQLNLDEDTYWILDPIDGTIAFLNRIPTWSTLLALVHKGEPFLGVVLLPALNQAFIASKGNGSRMGRLDFGGSESLDDQQWRPLTPRGTTSLAEAFISYSTPKQFAYRGIESFLSVLTEQAYECRSYGDAFGYTRILCGGIDAQVDPIVAPYDVAALQILFDETPGCVFTTLHNQRGSRRFRAGNCVAAATRRLSDQIISVYQNHLIETRHLSPDAFRTLSEPVQPETLSPTFLLPFESAETTHAAKLWARSVETAIALFLRENPSDFVEDVAVLLGSRESASRSLSNGSDEGPPEISASASFHIRAVVSGGSGLSTGTMDPDNSAVDLILSALKSAQSHKTQTLQPELGTVLLASRNQLIGHVGMHPWEPQSFAREFRDISELVRTFHNEQTDSRIHSIKSRVNLAVEYRWQYFLDGSQQTFVTHASRISTNATCADGGEKRTAYARYFENHFPNSQQVFPLLEQHFAKVKRQSIDLLSAQLVPEEPKYDYLAVDADLLGLILHEAVGHAAEGDLIQTGASGFGENGQMKELIVGPDWMDIVIDGNLENCGYLPVDAEGVQPRRKTIVRNGRLVDAIHTRQTALFARRAPDGCARMQSLQFPSLNRMTSIWVKPHKTNSLGNGAHGQPLDDLSFAEIQQALEQQGYLDGMHGVLFLSGWKGGTASCSNLEFRADVARILLLRKGQTPVLMREANFTGIATECFRSAVDAFGPVLCRSIGTCGKDGQGVLTSDGGPAFMVFSPNPKVKVIGTGDSEGANE
jgi:histidinol-phosphatase